MRADVTRGRSSSSLFGKISKRAKSIFLKPQVFIQSRLGNRIACRTRLEKKSKLLFRPAASSGKLFGQQQDWVFGFNVADSIQDVASNMAPMMTHFLERASAMTTPVDD
ncbi:hypothetical protein NL676_025369 [Syzygium grande]|nr:hypothetical protein NL676_025369 [Syzygium grande]